MGSICFFLIPGTQGAHGTSSYLLTLCFGLLFSGFHVSSLGTVGKSYLVSIRQVIVLKSRSLLVVTEGKGKREK